MEKVDIGKMASCCILAVLGAIAITKPDLTQNEGILRWLFFALACGLVINDQEGRPLKIIAASAIAASIILVLVITFKSYTVSLIPFSGSKISVTQNPDLYSFIMLALFIASFLGVVICSYARDIVLSLLNNLINIELEQARKVEAILNKIVSIGAVTMVIIFSIL
jgi:hypothetical protein